MKYSPEIVDQIIKHIEAGNFDVYAFKSVGISNQTFYSWQKEHKEFRELIKKAKSKRINTLVSNIAKSKNWTASAWLLERLDRKRFHLPTSQEKEFEDRLKHLEEPMNNEPIIGSNEVTLETFEGPTKK